MKHGNISIFIPHSGCPHKCSFCNQKNITGQVYQPSYDDVTATLDKAVADLGDNSKNIEIAFFGGSFTAVDRKYMLSLLQAANSYIDRFKGIRISTRPDCIDDEVLGILKQYGVTSIELGAQSMDDVVLNANNRGHTSLDVVKSSKMIRNYGFSLGLQMMTGLYMSDVQKDINTAKYFIKLRPDTVRIYPTVIMKDTDLADYYLHKIYVPYTLNKSVDLCSKLILMFQEADIAVIRLGLHYSDSLILNSYGDNYHPAFKELCESKIFYYKFLDCVKNIDSNKENFNVYINSKSLSKFLGQKKNNYNTFVSMGYKFKIKFDNSLKKYDLYIN